MIQENVNNNALAFTYSQHALQIVALQSELKSSRAKYQLCTLTLEELKFLNSHQVRQSICQILSLSGLLEQATNSHKVSSLVSYIKRAALSLDVFSKNMTLVMERQERFDRKAKV